MKERVVLVSCRLSRGGFPSECVFRLASEGGDLYGVAPIHYCYDAKQKPIQKELLPEDDIAGYIAGVVIAEKPDGFIVTYLPDGKTYELAKRQAIPVGGALPCTSPTETSSGPLTAAS